MLAHRRVAGDEDGPPSDGEGPAAEAETDDDDPLSDVEAGAPGEFEGAGSSDPAYRPTVWFAQRTD